jgi:dTDP-4-dehydrorhamnose 3,5-epimerase
MIEDILITPLKIIETPGGNVMHAMKVDDLGYINFGEAYFSIIKSFRVKAWKRHREMTLNLVVPFGIVRFVLYDDRECKRGIFQELIISKDNYCRLTVPPMVWMGFQGLSVDNSMLLNIADIKHNSQEVDKKNIEEIEFNWSNK